jgi:hypothetical protein
MNYEDGVFIQIVLFQVFPDVAQALVHPFDQAGIPLLVVGPFVAVVGIGIVFRKTLVIAAHVERGVDGVMGHVQIERLVGFPGVLADGIQAFESFLSESFRQEGVVFIIVVLVQALDVEIAGAVFLGTPVIRRTADFRAGDVVVEPEEFGVGSRRVLGAEVGLSAVNGRVSLLLEQGREGQDRSERLVHLVPDFLFRQRQMSGSGRFGACRLK